MLLEGCLVCSFFWFAWEMREGGEGKGREGKGREAGWIYHAWMAFRVEIYG